MFIEIGPLLITESTKWVQEIAARIAPGKTQETAKWIAAQGAHFNGGKPLEFETFDSRVGDLYQREQRFAKAIGYSTGLAIFVACLGIFGMSIFVSQQKIKEIAKRPPSSTGKAGGRDHRSHLAEMTRLVRAEEGAPLPEREIAQRPVHEFHGRDVNTRELRAKVNELGLDCLQNLK